MLKGLLIFVVVHLLLITLVTNTYSEPNKDERKIKTLNKDSEIICKKTYLLQCPVITSVKPRQKVTLKFQLRIFLQFPVISAVKSTITK